MRVRVGPMHKNGNNYDTRALSFNLRHMGLTIFPMIPADLEGSAGKSSLVSEGRLMAPFLDHTGSEGLFSAANYILQIPSHGGHWIALVPSALAGVSSA